MFGRKLTDWDKLGDELSNDSEPAGRSEKFLWERLNFFINDFRRKRNSSRLLANIFTVVTIGMGLVLTVLLGLRENALFSPDRVSIAALVLSAGLTSVNSWLAFADYKWKWIRYRGTLSALYTIRDDFHFIHSKDGKLSAKQIEEIFEQLKLTVHETNQEWMSQRGNTIAGAGLANPRGGASS